MAKIKTRRQKGRARQGKTIALCVGLGVAVVACGYGVLCVKANAEVLLPNTYVLGVNLGGMTWEEAASTLQQQVLEDYANETQTVTVAEEAVELNVAGLVRVDPDLAVDKAFAESQPGSFLSGGIAYLKALTVGTTVDVSEAVEFLQLDQALSDLSEAIVATNQAAVPTTYELTDTQIVFTKGVSGWSVDEEQLKTEILAALMEGHFERMIQCPLILAKPETFDLQGVYDEIYADPVDASCNPDGSIASSVQGVSFDLEEAQLLLDAAEEGNQVAIDLSLTDPEITTEKLNELIFRDLLGSASSTVGGSSSRRSNVAKVAEYVTGTILNPGETFSYNDVVGERTVARGFKEAPSYVSGETVNTVGGGVCQGSSTIYLAALRANMEIVERHAHSYICSYMPYGQDATVSYGSLDFQFRNDTDYPIKIVMSYADSELTVSIYGTNLTGNYVEITNQVNSTTAYQTVYENTTELAAGETKTKTTGYNGMSVTVYRNIYDADGNLISSEVENNTTYRVRNKVVLVGVAPAKTETPAASESPNASESPVVSESTAASESPAVSESPAPSTPVEEPAAQESPASSESTESE